MTEKRQPPNRQPAADPDARLWQNVTSGVKPIRRREPVPREKPPAASGSSIETERGESTRPRPSTPIERIGGSVSKPRPPEPELSHGAAPGVDKRTVARLRRGQLAIESQIDLHRFTQDQAHVALDRFLCASHRGGRRCVLVITGKGLRSEGPIGVLRHQVPRWLNEPINRARILAFCHATPADGGEGALYVLLRRRRPPTG